MVSKYRLFLYNQDIRKDYAHFKWFFVKDKFSLLFKPQRKWKFLYLPIPFFQFPSIEYLYLTLNVNKVLRKVVEGEPLTKGDSREKILYF